ncbi:MAG: polymer-forming cytoskeletal protein [Desulfuromonadaceae bacterium]|nr:polymer-forming cytoskeletal protein [Desulfuromonadaceae bacterium]
MFFSKQQNLKVVIGIESSVWGEITSKGTVRIDGVLEGGVTADCLIIGMKGIVTGDVTVRQIIVGGRIVGNIRASEGVDIQDTGDVCGDIFSLRLCITEGGKFEGRSSMLRTKEISYKETDTIAENS